LTLSQRQGVSWGHADRRRATGRTIEYASHEFYRIADGLIAEEWICSDMATLLRQLS
jgi:predicted ester cyclase